MPAKKNDADDSDRGHGPLLHYVGVTGIVDNVQMYSLPIRAIFFGTRC